MSKKCAKCEKTVYPLEELKCLDKIWHKTCFRCWECNMTLNMKNYKGFDKKPYCSAHYPTITYTQVSETPEMQRLAQNTKLQSQIAYHDQFEKSKGQYTTIADDPELLRIRKNQELISSVKYHEDFERMKGTKTSVVDDPESLRLRQQQAIISNVEYHGLKQKQHDMEQKRNLVDTGFPQGEVEQVADPRLVQPPPPQQQKAPKGRTSKWGNKLYESTEDQEVQAAAAQTKAPAGKKSKWGAKLHEKSEPEPPPPQEPPKQKGGRVSKWGQKFQQAPPEEPKPEPVPQQAPAGRRKWGQPAKQPEPEPEPVQEQKPAGRGKWSKWGPPPPAQQQTQGQGQRQGQPQQSQPQQVGQQKKTSKWGPQAQQDQSRRDNLSLRTQPVEQSRAGPVNVGRIQDYDPLNDQHGSIVHQPYSSQPGGHAWSETVPNPHMGHNQPRRQEQQQSYYPANPEPARVQQQHTRQEPIRQEPPPPQNNSNPLAGAVFKAMYDYEAAEEDEIGFRDGDIIVNPEPIDEGWMYGTVQRTGITGMLPANYVQRIK